MPLAIKENSKMPINANVAWRLILVLVCAIFTGEGLIMLAFTQMPRMQPWVEALVDASALSIYCLPLLYFLVFRPITKYIQEIKQVEAELRVAAVAFDSHEAIMITDAEATIIQVNQAFEQITGYSKEEVLGKNPRILASGRHDANFYSQLWQCLLDHGAWSGEIWDRHKDGHIYPKQSNITAIKNDDGVVTQYVSIFTDISERKEIEGEIYNFAFNDALTGLPNRRLFNDRLIQAMTASKRSGFYGALIFLDLDHFKPLNDKHGHLMGDMLLVEVASRLHHCVRATDTIARFGGDEFVILLNELDLDADESSQELRLVCEKISKALAAPYHLGGDKNRSLAYECTASIGAVLFINHEEKVEELLKCADSAMYQAKEAGGNTIRYYDF